MVKIKKHLELLGLNKLKSHQKDIINNFIQNKDTIGILPTGYGKSICYILPHLLSKKNVIVISPLISLMEDQHLSLEKKNINSILFNSNNHKIYSSKNSNDELSKIKDGSIKGILYFSPESFIKREFLIRDLLKSNSISLIAIDEAHCVDTWSEFRNSYNSLSCIKDWLNYLKINIPLLALTATATPETINILKKKLNLENPEIIKASFYRNNLSINIVKKHNLTYDIAKITHLIKNNNQKTLIYSKTIDDSEKISELLNNLGLNSKYYHGQMTSKQRKLTQLEFTDGDCNVMVATIAFGMGIDISNINLIIHYGVSKDLESYYQEIGRGGRDGSNTDCYLFWSKKDFQTNRHFLNNIKNIHFREKQMQKTLSIEKFIYNNQCRMKHILNYFGEDTFISCGKCDCCKGIIKNKSSEVGIIYMYLLFKTLNDLGYGCGSNTLVGILTGAKNNRIKEEMKMLTTFNSLKDFKKQELSDIIRQLHHEDYFIEKKINGTNGSYLKLSEKALIWFKNNEFIINKSKKILEKFFEKKKNYIYNLKIKGSIINYSEQPNLFINGNKKYIKFLKEGMAINQIVNKLQITRRSVENNICKLLNENYNLRLDWEKIDGPSIDKISEILAYSSTWNGKLLRDLKNKLPDNISYYEINLALTPQGKEIHSKFVLDNDFKLLKSFHK